jgi:hypothetical protein
MTYSSTLLNPDNIPSRAKGSNQLPAFILGCHRTIPTRADKYLTASQRQDFLWYNQLNAPGPVPGPEKQITPKRKADEILFRT